MKPTPTRAEAETAGAWSAGLALPAALLAGLATVLMLEGTRVFVAYLIFVVDQSRRVELGVSATLVFGATGLGGLLLRRAGPRAALAVSAGLLLGARLVLQFWGAPEPRIILGAACIIGWGWLLIVLLTFARDAAGLGLVLGLGLDVALRIAFRTVDLPFLPGAAQHLAALVLIAGAAACGLLVLRERWPAPKAAAPAFSLAAIGPGLAIFHLMTGNLGLAQTLLDVDFAAAAFLTTLGVLLGLGIVLIELLGRALPGGRSWLLSPRLEGPLAVVVLALVALAGAWLFWQRPALTGAGYVAGVAGSLVLLSTAVLSGRPGGAGRAGGVALPFVVGMLAQVALLFAYYSLTGEPVVIVVAWVLLLAGAFFSGPPAEIDPGWRPRSLAAATGTLALLLLLAAGIGWLASDEPAGVGPLGNELTVVVYNLQNGFARDNRYTLDEQAEVIRAAKPDIVILQEVSRGWLVAAGVDEARWLSEELDMPFAFGASSGDGLWGNLILSRAPLSDIERHFYESSQNLERGALEVRVETTAGPLLVFSTHLDNPSGAGEVRLEQAEQLLDAWDGRAPAVIGGDFNADPDSDVLALLQDAGLLDSGAALPPGSTTSEDGRRIDYLLATAEMATLEARVVETWASDHRPLVVLLRLGP